ncbi:MAG TPA: hypothetical protein VFG36_04905 [Methanoregula sp.]|nr:hypothetical protein [Methanoregula sp.]
MFHIIPRFIRFLRFPDRYWTAKEQTHAFLLHRHGAYRISRCSRTIAPGSLAGHAV